jgi:hypothetical protein
VLQRLLEVVRRGDDEVYLPATLGLLRALLQVPGVQLLGGVYLASDEKLFDPVSALLDRPKRVASLALEVTPASANRQTDAQRRPWLAPVGQPCRGA